MLFSKSKSPRSIRNTISRLIGLIESKPITERIILRTLFFVTIGGILMIGLIINDTFLATTPVEGGNLVEGIVGIPRFVNPALAVTKADQDMTMLIYSGIMKINPDGNLVPDIAETVTISEDGKTYNIIIKPEIFFHDGTPLTSKDIAFTIGLVQNPDLKSPLRGNWSGVTTEIINDHELNVMLEEAYAPFIENFILGILPRHIWGELPIEQIPFSQRNTNPIGTGPFFIKNTVRGDTGLITNYTLNRFTRNQPIPKLASIEVKFYQNEDSLVTAFNKKEILSTAYLPTNTLVEIMENPKYSTIQIPLPRVFAIFFNQNRSPAFRDISVRKALAVAINRDNIIDFAFSGFGIPTTNPIPPTQNTLESQRLNEGGSVNTDNKEDAVKLLTDAGWTKNDNELWEKRINKESVILSVIIKTANDPVLDKTTQAIADLWREIGVDVQIEQFEQTDLLQSVIRPRDFNALLFGIDMSRVVDLYPFWHSSQREDPGLNIANYANIEVDSFLQKARTTQNIEERIELTGKAVSIIDDDIPAIFLFVPTLTYVVDSKVTPTPITKISKPSERFMNITDWNMNTDKIWNFFR